MLSRRQLLLGMPAVALGGLAARPALADGECSGFDGQGWRYCTVGLRIGEIETVRQQCPYWCWAACIQAVFALHGHAVAQEAIVARLFGDLICAPADAWAILAAIEGDWTDSQGRRFQAWGEALPDLTTRLFMGAGAQDMVVMCVGRLAAEKNLDLLLQAGWASGGRERI